jgi:peptidoglycan L-alanyl-D-glutamate endopeptidase CwlK
MRAWSHNSRKVYNTLDPRLQRVMDRILHEVADVSLVSGHRDQEEQNDAFDEGVSTLRYPDSKHNSLPSIAVDFQPYPYPNYEPKLWGALGYIAGRALGIALEEGVTLRWGGDWDGDGDTTDQSFDDLFHLEITK